ncbi:4Fe-4S binding protein [Trichlorobacter lovleyi]|uniref:ATP-binding protein n=1 Tax=Trichlorobacter lovleyi TaxID=313985 RepID=UPI00223EE2EC|nr:4Fe-4S binding protein [Trichlorobacter lovleyi]QOX80410.1 4Fe-4S binding protein [Trichlorobacter lovleyi]
MLRKIVKIDPDKCDGCGLCVPSCAEGAITIINGKAVLAADNLCDGLGACLGECPKDAISIEERDTEAFDEAAVVQHLTKAGKAAPAQHGHGQAAHAHGGGCPGSRMQSFGKPETAAAPATATGSARANRQSRLTQWPVQMQLVSPTAPYFQGADLLLTADCVPVAYAGYHEDFLDGKAVIMGCPKLDDNQFFMNKLIEILKSSDIRSVTVLKMEVPCCGGIAWAAKEAIKHCGKIIPYAEVTIGIQGNLKR